MKINLDTVADDAQIQIVPMIDVIFCILTFFILAALQVTRQNGINMNVGTPQAKTGVVQMSQMLVVSIDESGQTFIDQNVVDPAQLYTLLKQYREKNPNGLLVLNASKFARYDNVIQVLDVLRTVGGDKVALATIPSPTIAPMPNPSNGQFGMPGTTPNLFPQNGGLPGMPAVPGQTDPLLPPSNNPFAQPGSTQPSTVIPPSNLPPGGTNNSPSLSPTGVPNTTPDGQPTGEPALPSDADIPDVSQPLVPNSTPPR
jgi:biopolymer transport protein ExbD